MEEGDVFWDEMPTVVTANAPLRVAIMSTGLLNADADIDELWKRVRLRTVATANNLLGPPLNPHMHLDPRPVACPGFWRDPWRRF